MIREAQNLPAAPMRRKPSAGAEGEAQAVRADADCARRMHAIVDALLFRGMGVDEAAQRLAVLMPGDGDGCRRLCNQFRAFVRVRHSPRTAVHDVARVVQEWCAGSHGAYVYCPPFWTTTDLQRRLYMFALVIGFNGRTFGMAKNAVAAEFGADGAQVREFVRKAKRYGMVEELPKRRAEKGRWRPMSLFRLADRHCGELESHESLFMRVADGLPWIFGSVRTSDELADIADDVVRMVELQTRGSR